MLIKSMEDHGETIKLQYIQYIHVYTVYSDWIYLGTLLNKCLPLVFVQVADFTSKISRHVAMTELMTSPNSQPADELEQSSNALDSDCNRFTGTLVLELCTENGQQQNDFSQ